jgi:hypothetical protein
MGEPLIPLTVSPATKAMCISAAYRQAAIDASSLPAGVHFFHEVVEDQGRVTSVTIRVRDAYGAIVWEHPYDRHGRRIGVAAGVTW